ncbi:hypothetical protein ACQP00_43120 [Dactylosporangium sp. CS-047395]|uniref:hypothetical protein n=1 Tax=Dactylosporangium sp. CS-047395 TaxID=3239936 RepID=UPI003D90C743
MTTPLRLTGAFQLAAVAAIGGTAVAFQRAEAGPQASQEFASFDGLHPAQFLRMALGKSPVAVSLVFFPERFVDRRVVSAFGRVSHRCQFGSAEQ